MVGGCFISLKLLGVELLSLVTQRDGPNLSHRAEIQKIQAAPGHRNKLKAPIESTRRGPQTAEFDLKKKKKRASRSMSHLRKAMLCCESLLNELPTIFLRMCIRNKGTKKRPTISNQ